MHFLWKLLLANAVIAGCSIVGRRVPSAAGLIATMPLTTLIVLIWLHAETPADHRLILGYTRGVLWGILPSIAFYAVALLCFQRRVPFAATLCIASTAWFIGALIHRLLVR